MTLCILKFSSPDLAKIKLANLVKQEASLKSSHCQMVQIK